MVIESIAPTVHVVTCIPGVTTAIEALPAGDTAGLHFLGVAALLPITVQCWRGSPFRKALRHPRYRSDPVLLLLVSSFASGCAACAVRWAMSGSMIQGLTTGLACVVGWWGGGVIAVFVVRLCRFVGAYAQSERKRRRKANNHMRRL